jgi:hypothetical protein
MVADGRPIIIAPEWAKEKAKLHSRIRMQSVNRPGGRTRGVEVSLIYARRNAFHQALVLYKRSCRSRFQQREISVHFPIRAHWMNYGSPGTGQATSLRISDWSDTKAFGPEQFSVQECLWWSLLDVFTGASPTRSASPGQAQILAAVSGSPEIIGALGHPSGVDFHPASSPDPSRAVSRPARTRIESRSVC